tara:strand:+ start:794 stop:1069 length:276 start_codon:yes stop_codon:yes gene_type:complete
MGGGVKGKGMDTSGSQENRPAPKREQAIKRLGKGAPSGSEPALNAACRPGYIPSYTINRGASGQRREKGERNQFSHGFACHLPVSAAIFYY